MDREVVHEILPVCCATAVLKSVTLKLFKVVSKAIVNKCEGGGADLIHMAL